MDWVFVIGVVALLLASAWLDACQRIVWRQLKEMRRRYEADHQRRMRELQALLEECACIHDDECERKDGAK